MVRDTKQDLSFDATFARARKPEAVKEDAPALPKRRQEARDEHSDEIEVAEAPSGSEGGGILEPTPALPNQAAGQDVQPQEAQNVAPAAEGALPGNTTAVSVNAQTVPQLPASQYQMLNGLNTSSLSAAIQTATTQAPDSTSAQVQQQTDPRISTSPMQPQVPAVAERRAEQSSAPIPEQLPPATNLRSPEPVESRPIHPQQDIPSTSKRPQPAIQTSSSESSPSRAPIIPAAARAVQLETTISFENLGQSLPAEHRPAATSLFSTTLASPSAQSADGNISAQITAQGRELPDVQENPVGQLARGLRAALQQRGGTVNLRLDPPELGELRIHMNISRGVVSAEFHASTPQAQHLLEKSLTALRSTLEHQGLSVDRLSVSTHSTGSHSLRYDANNSDQSLSQREQQHDAAGGQSRGRRDESPPQRFRPYAPHDFESLVADLSR